jgi:non-ribosomal peptide synthetase component F
VARKLQHHAVQKEEPVLILAERGINHIVSQVAVVYAGGSCVPLDVGLPDGRIAEVIRHLRSRVALTDTNNVGRCPTLAETIVDSTSRQDMNGCNGHLQREQGEEMPHSGPMACSHIIHTSGSTGTPKAV